MSDPTERSETRTVTVHLEPCKRHSFTDGMTCDWCQESDHHEALAIWMGEECIGIYCAGCEANARRMVDKATEEARDAAEA